MNEQYNLLAEFGRVDGQTVYLARERTTGKVAIARRRSDDPSGPLTISHVLDATVPADGAVCSACIGSLRSWGRFCPSCGREVFGAQSVAADGPTPDQLLDAVRHAAEGRFDVLGSIPRADGGDTIYFAVDLNTADVVALLLNREGIEADGTLAYSLELPLTLSPVAASPPAPPPAPPPKVDSYTPPPPVSRIVPPSAITTERPRRTTAPIPEPTTPVISPPPEPEPEAPRRRPLPKGVVIGAAGLIVIVGVVFVAFALRPKSEPPLPPPVVAAHDTMTMPMPVADTAKPEPAPDTTTVAAAPAPVAPTPTKTAPPPPPAPARRKPAHVNPRDTIGLAEATRACSSSTLAGNWTEAAPSCERAAAAGDADAELSLGMMYQRGNGVSGSMTDAVKWFRKAADQGSPRAMNYLGWAYANGDGVKRNGAEAIKLFQKSADAGNSQGEYGLGMMYANGTGVMRSDSLAVVWFRKAAIQEPLARAELTRRGLTP